MKFTLLAFVLLPFSAFATDCRDNILRNTCFVEKDYEWDTSKTVIENLEAEFNRECLSGTQNYAKEIFDLYPSLPEHSKKAFCFIEKIFIVKQKTPYGGRASTAFDFNNPVLDPRFPSTMGLRVKGFVMSLSKIGRFDLRETEAEYIYRLNHSQFGINIFDGDKPDPRMPTVSYVNDLERSSLYTTIVHEIGHFLDYAAAKTHAYQRINNQTLLDSKWTLESWDTEWIIDDFWGEYANFIPQNVPLIRNAPNKLTQIEEVFTELLSSSFTSFYSTTSPAEDFADFYKDYLLKGNFVFTRQDGTVYEEVRPISYHDKEVLMEEYMAQGFNEIFNGEIFWFSTQASSNPIPDYLRSNCIR